MLVMVQVYKIHDLINYTLLHLSSNWMFGEGDVQISSQHKSMSLGDRSFEVVGDQSNNLSLLKVGHWYEPYKIFK